MKEHDETAAVRLDKWLWAARFFKTRGLAAEAIKGGKVEINGTRAKPARSVRIGDRLQVRRGPELFEVDVAALSQQRGPAAQAVLLYQETVQSRERREEEAALRKAEALSRPKFPGRPTKRDRREIVRFKKEHDNG